VVNAKNHRGLCGENAERERFAEPAEHHPILLAALECLERMLIAARVHANGFYATAEDEADRCQGIVKLVNNRSSIVVGNRSELRDFKKSSVADTPKVIVRFEQVSDIVDWSIFTGPQSGVCHLA